VIGNEGFESLISLFKNKHVSPAMFDNVSEGWLVSSEGPEPLFWLDGILLVLRSEEFTDGDEAVVAEFQGLPRRAPSVNVSILRQSRQAMIKESGIDKRDVIPGPKMSKPYIAIKQEFRDILEQFLFQLDDVIAFIVAHTEHLWLACAHLLKPDTQHHAEVCGEV
jgi:hypothetical protein